MNIERKKIAYIELVSFTKLSAPDFHIRLVS
jgi:hypothetical protein